MLVRRPFSFQIANVLRPALHLVAGILDRLTDGGFVGSAFNFDLSARSTKARSTEGNASTALVTVWAQWPQVMPETFSVSMGFLP